MKKIIPLIDLNAKQNSFWEESEKLGLDYGFLHISINDIDKYESLVITDQVIPQIERLNGKKLFLWLMEPPSIFNWTYNFAAHNYQRFERIFSHNLEFCQQIPNAVWYPWGSYYIPLEEHSLYPKSKNCSIVASAKNYAEGHQFRHNVISKYSNLIDGIKQGDPVEPKILWHKDFRFSIAIENSIIPGYFTEKIIDCFRAGVIPIYRGCPEMIKHFNSDGIIPFSELEELAEILPKCNEELYLSKLSAVKDNFAISENFLYPWKYITEHYLHEIL